MVEFTFRTQEVYGGLDSGSFIYMALLLWTGLLYEFGWVSLLKLRPLLLLVLY